MRRDQETLALQFSDQLFFGRQDGAVFLGEQLLAFLQNRILDYRFILVRAEGNSDGGIVVVRSSPSGDTSRPRARELGTVNYLLTSFSSVFACWRSTTNLQLRARPSLRHALRK